jgi:sigma-E factor negative regulatory protein RseA
MSEQIREQVSAFLDGELPSSETDLLLKRLVRDAELRERFGSYALIGEACRSERHSPLARDLCTRVNRAIDGEAVTAAPVPASAPAAAHWSRPVAGAALAAGVAVVAVFALQHRAITRQQGPTLVANAVQVAAPEPVVAAAAGGAGRAPAPNQFRTDARPIAVAANVAESPREKNLSPAGDSGAPRSLAPAQVASYVFAHGQVSPLFTQRDVFTDMIVDGGQQATPVAVESAR